MLERRRNRVVRQVVLRGMGLTGGHHPRREANSSLTSPTAHSAAFSSTAREYKIFDDDESSTKEDEVDVDCPGFSSVTKVDL